jgi:Fe-S-cluster-containing dehydrogenase component
MRYGMIIKSDQCIGCCNCFLTCQDEFCGKAYEGYAVAAPLEGHQWIRVTEVERGQSPRVKMSYIPVTCMHCEAAPCIAAAENNAVYRRPDVIVVIDPEKAAGQKQLVLSCPYRVIEWNEQAQLAQKCNMCAHALDKGAREPRCIESCPTNAIVFGDLDDAASEISQLLRQGATESLRPELGLKEKVRYIGLPKRFVAGTVVLKDKQESAHNAQVELYNKKASKTTRTSPYGDFEFEGLEANQSFSLKISLPGYKEKTLRCKTAADTHVGEIFLNPQV